MAQGVAGAEWLHSIFGTEKDRVNCPFYFKIGACRHGDHCERRHNRPSLSQTILMPNMYIDPRYRDPETPENVVQEEFEIFYEDVFVELERCGELDELNVCENVCDHLAGNVYVKYRREEDAAKAMKLLQSRFYAGRPVAAEFSPVTDFRESSCRQFENNECTRGGLCNFMHLRTLSKDLYRELFRSGPTHRHSRKRSRSRSRSRDRREKRHHSDRGHDDRRDRDRRDGDRDRRDGDRRDGDRDRSRNDSNQQQIQQQQPPPQITISTQPPQPNQPPGMSAEELRQLEEQALMYIAEEDLAN